MNERASLVRRVLLGQFDGFVNRNGRGDLLVEENLPHADTQQRTVNHRHAVELPVTTVRRDLFVDLALVIDDAINATVSALAQGLAGFNG